MATKSVANCVSIPSETYTPGQATLVLNAGGTAYYHCSYIDLQDSFNAIARYQNQDSVGSDWTDISSQTGEGIFVINSSLPSTTTNFETMTQEDFKALWPAIVGLLVTGFIFKFLRHQLFR